MADDDTQISIPFPRPSANVNRGYLDGVTKVSPTRPTSIRFTDDDRVTIDKAATALGMSFGEFTKWCGYYAAIQVNNEIVRKSFEDKKTAKVIDTSGYK